MGKLFKFSLDNLGLFGKRRLSGVVLMLLVLAGSCVESLQEEEMDALLLSSGGYGISDAAHGGTEGFYFLPPLVTKADYQGEFEPKLSPVVEISSDLTFSTIHASFSMGTTGPNVIRQAGGHYHVNWSGNKTKAKPGHVYRIRVRLGNEVLGHADVAVVRNGREHVRDGLIRMNVNQTLPIKFRIEKRESVEVIRIELTWRPQLDLDAHLTGPIPGTTERFHIEYADKGSLDSSPYAMLLNDDLTGTTGEVILISRFFEGTYRFLVDNHEAAMFGGTPLKDAEAKVKVYKGIDLLAVFEVPQESGTVWTVFDMDGGSKEITSINQLKFGGVPTDLSRLMPENRPLNREFNERKRKLH